MKRSIISITLTTLLVTASATALAESFDISVTGNITPAACKATLAGGEVFDYGDILVGTLSKDEFTILPAKSTNFSIVCDAPAKLGIYTTDNRHGTNNNPVGKTLAGITVTGNTNLMGLGTDGKGNKIGAFSALIPSESVTVDTSETVDSIWSGDKGASWKKGSSSGVAFVNNANIWTWSKVGETTPISFSTLNGTINVQAAISPSSSLDLSQPVKMDGSATVQLYYL